MLTLIGRDWLGCFKYHGNRAVFGGRWIDNVFIERLWRSVKYEEIYLFEHATVNDLCTGLKKWFQGYNTWRPYASLGNLTRFIVYAASGDEASMLGILKKTKKVS